MEEIRFDLKNETQSHKACELELSELKEKYNQALDDSEWLSKITTLEKSIAGFKGEITKKDKEITELQVTLKGLNSCLIVRILTTLKGLFNENKWTN